MIETLHTVAAFVVAIALLIAVHEYGHFIVARKLGIKVEKFSIGFGPALFSWHSRDREVEYVIAAIPLGGYVKMLGENPSEQGEDVKQELSEEDKARAFDIQPVWKRASVAVAGPMFNFLFAIVAYMLIAWLGQTILPPTIGSIQPASLAERHGLVDGDRVTRIAGREVRSWQQLEERLKQHVGRDVRIELERGGSPVSLHLALPATEKDALLVNVADEVLGISPGMRILVDMVVLDSPAEKAGLKPGDEIIRTDGSPVKSVRSFIQVIREHAGQDVDLGVRRGDMLLTMIVQPEADSEGGMGRIGARMAAQPLTEPELYRMGLAEGIAHGFVRTWEMTALTLQVIGKMLSASISPETLGGPIAIAQLAGKTAELGLVSFIAFLALISVNLAVLNLLPVPVLDGGHLLYLLIEKVRGRPLSQVMMERTQIIGMALIVMLMVFAFYNDIARLFRG